MLPKRAFYITGGAFFAIGLVFLVNQLTSLTGNAILEGVPGGADYRIGVWFVLSGIVTFFFLSSHEIEKMAESEKGILVFESANVKKNEGINSRYLLRDPERYLGKSEITLGEFKKIVGQVKSDKEIRSKVDSVYRAQLEDIVQSGDAITSAIAKEFLKALKS